ncbi:beta-N-acetylhexosaminidase [Aidingimonas halophila]|uniref:Beta-hexosaminidase n=1 Tax=Aidingimonas halophila TaxID=574349 RepID=A0A1H3B4A6_9GAMM|nr:beta-N-acetylhexosaminidase [Aidingimonas halophila]GHC25885.1 beta-hexosaminidase [Aidingimonas halophila]SDX36786.1 beta-N-acetylhexosaminidase [Aidingimonas halophila]
MTQPLGPLMLDLEGTWLTSEESDLLMRPEVGGVILFSRNIEDAGQVQALCEEVRRVRPDLLLAIDQEGGRVQRLREGVTRLPSMAVLASGYDEQPETVIQRCQDAGWLLGLEMAACGLDIVFAPVLDVDSGISSVIGDRSFSHSPEVVTALGGAFIDGLHEAGMVAIGKHFPGHGGVEADSHHEVPVDPRPMETLRARDLVPFAALASRLQGVMPAHVIYSAFDHRPAGFSPYWLGMLREDVGFKGAIFSDDLSMTAAGVAGGTAHRVTAALDAGCDMALVCNDREAVLSALPICQERQGKRHARLRYGRARPNLDSLSALSRWRRTHARLEALASTPTTGGTRQDGR